MILRNNGFKESDEKKNREPVPSNYVKPSPLYYSVQLYAKTIFIAFTY